MKQKLISFSALALAASIVASPAAFAEDDKDKFDDYDPKYSSFRIAVVDTDFDNLGRAINLGGTLGMRIPGLTWDGTEFLSVEIDLSATIIPGENDGGDGSAANCDGDSNDGGLVGGFFGGGGGGGSDCTTTATSEEFQLLTIGAFIRARSPGRYFAAGRVGYSDINSNINELSEDGAGFAWSFGGGYQYHSNGGAVELVYSQYGSRVGMIELSISY